MIFSKLFCVVLPSFQESSDHTRSTDSQNSCIQGLCQSYLRKWYLSQFKLKHRSNLVIWPLQSFTHRVSLIHCNAIKCRNRLASFFKSQFSSHKGHVHVYRKSFTEHVRMLVARLCLFVMCRFLGWGWVGLVIGPQVGSAPGRVLLYNHWIELFFNTTIIDCDYPIQTTPWLHISSVMGIFLISAKPSHMYHQYLPERWWESGGSFN